MHLNKSDNISLKLQNYKKDRKAEGGHTEEIGINSATDMITHPV